MSGENALFVLSRRIKNLLSRGRVVKVNSSGKVQRVQLVRLKGENDDALEHMEPYGFTSCAKPGAEHVTGYFDGDRSNGAVLVVSDRRFRVQGLAEGEVALYTDEGDSIQLKRGRNINVSAGTKITATAPEVDIVATTKVRFVTPLVEATQDMTIGGSLSVTGAISSQSTITGLSLVSHGDVTAFSLTTPISMSNMKLVYNGHQHAENPLPGNTAIPNSLM